MMKKVLAIFLFTTLLTAVKAQDVNNGGKTYYYYDELTKKKVKEIFHFVELIQITPDKKNPGSYVDTLIRIKHGPYTAYHENGLLMKSGYFKDGQMDSVWIFYNIKGAETNRELYRHGKLVK